MYLGRPTLPRRSRYTYRTRGVAGLGAGNTSNASAAASYASTGATVGSVIPGIGTAIGAVIGAAYGVLSNKHTAKSEIVWDDYKKIAGAQPGSAIDPMGFEQAFEGMWKTNNKALGGINKTWPSREPFKVELVNYLAQGLLGGKINLSQGTAAIYDNYVLPWLMSKGADQKVYSAYNDPRRQIMVDLTDRILSDMFVGRDRVPNLTGNTDLHVPNLSEAMCKIQPASNPVVAPSTSVASSSGPAVNVPAAPAVTAQQAPGGAAPIIPPVAATDAMQLIQSMQAQNATPADMYTAALAKLQQAGVPITPQVQQAVANQVNAPNWLPYALGGVALLVAFYAFSRRRRR